jgi:MFS transporter, DHA2 family, methylenomycin A resistance protein
MAVFVVASAACGLAPNLGVLVAARLVQGAGAAVMMPSSLTLIREAYPDSVRRGRAIGVWTIAGAVAAGAGPVAGGALNLVSWRMIFFINLPAGAVALILLARAPRSPRREVPFDWAGQVLAVVAMSVLTFGVIEAEARGFGAPEVMVALAVAAAALAAFLGVQARGKHPMVPLDLFRSRTVVIASGTGFAFMAGFYGLVFVYSIYLQQVRGLSPLATGLVFLPSSVASGFVSPISARLAERFGPRVPIVGGMFLMGRGGRLRRSGGEPAARGAEHGRRVVKPPDVLIKIFLSERAGCIVVL